MAGISTRDGKPPSQRSPIPVVTELNVAYSVEVSNAVTTTPKQPTDNVWKKHNETQQIQNEIIKGDAKGHARDS